MPEFWEREVWATAEEERKQTASIREETANFWNMVVPQTEDHTVRI
jgi:hypothetical protein